MVKLGRVKQEIFAGQAGSNQVTAFGTAKTDNPIYTTDLTQIQNQNFLQGWLSAILADKSPWEEDMNALFYAITTQLAYILQEGIPEYDGNTTYYIGSLAKSVDNQGKITIYKSLIEENMGNPLTDPTYWAIYSTENSTGEATYEIGLPQPTLSNNLYPNEIWLEGQTVSRTTYTNLFAIYGTTYGAGNGTSTFKLPDFRNRVMWGASSFGYINAGLPNITGTVSAGHYSEADISSSGCFYEVSRHAPGDNGDFNEKTNVVFGFNASRSSGIYGNSATVQPPAIKVRVKTRFQ